MKGKLFKYLFIAQTAVILLLVSFSVVDAGKKDRFKMTSDTSKGTNELYIVTDKKTKCEYLIVEGFQSVAITPVTHNSCTEEEK